MTAVALQVVDTHCHLYDTRGADVAEVIDAAHAAGVMAMITVGCDRATSQAALALAERFPHVHPTVGLHPHDAVNGVDEIVDLLDAPGVLAVGECGLDYYYDRSPHEIQRRVFAEQIDLANERDLPLVIHSRDAWDDTLEILHEQGVPARTIFHCFTGGPADAKRCLDVGAYLSFSGIVTFNNAADIRAAAALCPPDRLLVETDSPYLAPVPYRGRTNQPAFVVHVVEAIAALRGQTPGEVADQVVANARTAFPGLPQLA